MSYVQLIKRTGKHTHIAFDLSIAQMDRRRTTAFMLLTINSLMTDGLAFVLAAQSPAATVMNAAALAADDRVYLQSLYSALPPSALLRAIYPVLSSYKTPDEEVGTIPEKNHLRPAPLHRNRKQRRLSQQETCE